MNEASAMKSVKRQGAEWTQCRQRS